MKNVLFTLAALTLLAGCESADETGPVPLAKHFMAEFYSVKPDSVNVSVKPLDEKTQLTAVLAQVGQHACMMKMSPAPIGSSARFGWLVSSMQCDLSECGDTKSSEFPEWDGGCELMQMAQPSRMEDDGLMVEAPDE